MPRPPRRTAPEPQAESSPQANSVIASAATLAKRPAVVRRGLKAGSEWQQQAWYYFDTIGELRFGVNWVANALSRVTLGVVRDIEDGEQETVTEGLAADALDSLCGGEDGQSQMLSAFGLHLSVPGEAYLIGEPPPDDETGEDRWLVAAKDEITERGKRWWIDRGDGKREIADDSLIIRIWRPHPRQWVQADSSVRAVLPVLREIEQLTKHVAASVDSRLAGAGIFMVPSEMTFTSPSGEGTEEGVDGDPFMAQLTEAMVTPIEDRGSASAVVPVVVKAPGALIGEAKHITFSTPLDENALTLRVEALRRLALGLDIPPEVVLGQGDSNHWSAWQIEESALKVHIEPLLELICTALTEEFLRPALTAQGEEDVDRLHVVADTSALRLRPDHSSQAMELYDRLELSGDGLRRETGFEDEDAPDEEEIVGILLRKIALSAATPEAAAAAAEALGVALQGPPAPEVAPTPVETPPAPEPPAIETRRPIPEQRAASLLAAGEVMVLRAVERANNRLNRRGKTRRPFTHDECDLGLADAWDHVPRVAELLAVDPDWLVTELDRYTRGLLTTGAEHTPPVLARCLDGTRRAG